MTEPSGTSSDETRQKILKSSLENASLNIALQISFRFVTFCLNSFVIRNVSPEAVGVMYVRLLLLESTILFLSRDAFRKACLTKAVDHDWPGVINLIWLTVPLCVILSVIFGYIWLYVLTPPDPEIVDHYTLGVYAIAISCVIDMLAEPLYLISQVFLFVKLRVFSDALCAFARTLIFVSIMKLFPDDAILAFSAAQIGSVFVYTFFFYSFFLRYVEENDKSEREFPFQSWVDFLPGPLENKDHQIDRRLLALVWSFSKQGVLMQILTEGERYVMTLLNVLTFAEQGVFDVVNNLGSMAARFIFRPVEESAYFYYAQMIHRDEPIEKQDKICMEQAVRVLECVVRSIACVGLCIICFGRSYSALLLHLYGGRNFSVGLGPTLLRAHCLAIFLIAVNGSTECYALSTMNTQQLNKYNRVMVAFSIVFLCAAWLLSYLFGSPGFIMANCCNMTARIIHSLLFIRKRYKNTEYTPLLNMIPKIPFLIAVFVSAVITSYSEQYFGWRRPFLHVFAGATCFSVTAMVWAYTEGDLLQSTSYSGVRLWPVSQLLQKQKKE